MKKVAHVLALILTASVSHGDLIPILNGDFETDGHDTTTLTGWTATSGAARTFLFGSEKALISTGNTTAFQVTHVGLGLAIAPNTQYTLDWAYGNGASGSTGVGTATWTVELGTIDTGVFTPLATQNEEVTTTTNGEIFFTTGNQQAGTPLVFSTGAGVSGDDLSVRLSAGSADITWQGFDNITLDATSVVPEPASVALLGLGGLALLLRRRR